MKVQIDTQSNVTVLILAAGVGERLRPITDYVPKCLVPISGKPLLYHWLDGLVPLESVSEIYVNYHHHAEAVKEAIEKYNSKKIIGLHEKILLGTAATIENLICRIPSENDLLVIHADNFSTVNLTEFMMDAHQNDYSTLLAFHAMDIRGCSIVTVTDGNSIALYESAQMESSVEPLLVNGATYYIKKSHLNFVKQAIRETGAHDFSKEVIPTILQLFRVWSTRCRHTDIGYLDRYISLVSEVGT